MLATASVTAERLWRYQDNHLVIGANCGLLGDYRLAAGPRALGNGVTQASGLSFDEERQHLYLVANAPPRLLELDADGALLRSVELRGFDDTEGVAYLGADRFALLSERQRRLFRFKLAPDTAMLDVGAAVSYPLPSGGIPNRGPEGISFDADSGRLYLVYESHPRRVLRVDWPPAGPGLDLTEPWEAEARPWFGLRNLSGVQIHAESGHLLVLSRKSRVIVEFTPEGREVGRLYLKAGSAGLQERIAHPEGIAISSDGRLFVCGEPDLLYEFRPQSVGAVDGPRSEPAGS
jgi:uncharacterized protein YjiK